MEIDLTDKVIVGTEGKAKKSGSSLIKSQRMEMGESQRFQPALPSRLEQFDRIAIEILKHS